jgi:phospholipid/cholesterol/gamma-HCH transport system substrate-binding protein
VYEGQVPVIVSQRRAFSELMECGVSVLTGTIEALDRVNRVLSDQNIQTFGAALSDLQAVTAEARERKAVIADAQKALQSIDLAAQEISAVSRSGKELVDTDGKRTLKELGDAAEEIKAAAKDIRGMVGNLEGPTSDFATSGLPQLTSAIVTLQSAAESLERLSNEIEQSPQGLIGKSPAKEVEVQP